VAVQIATRPITAPGNTSPGSAAVRPAGSSPFTDLRRQTSQLLHDALDEGRLRQLRTEGEAMDSDQAAAYALEAIRRARQSQAHRRYISLPSWGENRRDSSSCGGFEEMA
jgi:hypothetical protein